MAAAASTVLVRADDLYRFYHAADDETLALRGVSLRVQAGEVVAVTGPSGSGKSTLLACLAGLEEPDGGTVRIAGKVVSRRPEAVRAELRGRSIGMLFQSGNLLEHLDIDANLAVAQRLAGGGRPIIRRDLLDQLGLRSREHSTPAELSGGELARAGLAVALVNDPPIVLADEPTGEVDADTEQQILALLRDRAGFGRAVVVASHSPAVAAAADRVVHLIDGRVAR